MYFLKKAQIDLTIKGGYPGAIPSKPYVAG